MDAQISNNLAILLTTTLWVGGLIAAWWITKYYGNATDKLIANSHSETDRLIAEGRKGTEQVLSEMDKRATSSHSETIAVLERMDKRR